MYIEKAAGSEATEPLVVVEKAVDLQPGEELQEFIGAVNKAVQRIAIDEREELGYMMLHGIFADHVIIRASQNCGVKFYRATYQRANGVVTLGKLEQVRMSFTPVAKKAETDDAASVIFDLL